MVVRLAAGADDAHLTAAIPDLDIGEETADGFKNINPEVTADEKVDGLGAKGAGENFSQAVTVIEHVKNFTSEVDIEKLTGEKQVGIAGVIDMTAIKSGKGKRFGSFGEDADGFTKEVVGVTAIVPNIFLDGNLFGNREIAFLH